MKISNPFNQDSQFYRLFYFVGQLMILNFCFLVSSVPVVTAGAASSALIYAFRHDRTCRDFILGFRENFRQSTVIWILFAVLFCASVFAFLKVREYASVILTVVIVFVAYNCVMLFAWGSVYVCFFNAPVLTVMKNCMVLGAANIVKSVSAVVTVLVTPVVFLLFPYWALRLGFIWFTFGFALVGYSNFVLLRPVLEQLANRRG